MRFSSIRKNLYVIIRGNFFKLLYGKDIILILYIRHMKYTDNLEEI